MAHELDSNAKTGKLSYVGVKLSPWHSEGFTLPYAPSFEEAATLAGWDYGIRVVKLSDVMPSYKMYKEFQAVVREDTNMVLAVMGEDYNYLLNRDAFEVAKPLLDKGLAEIETSGTLRQGADAWLLLKFKIDSPIVKEVFASEVIPFGLLTNNHTGQSRALLKETPIRVVCANTLGLSLGQKTREIRVKHRGDVKVKMVTAAMEMYEGLIERYETCAQQYKMMKAVRMSETDFVENILNLICPLPEESEDTSKRGYEKALNIAMNKQAAMFDKWHNGKGHVGDDSVWEAYNGIVEVVDHDDEVYRMNKNKETGLYNSRVESLIDGRLSKIKDEALEACLAYCQDK